MNESQFETCGSCRFFQPNESQEFSSEQGMMGTCSNLGITTYEKWTPIQALRESGQEKTSRNMEIEGWSCHQPPLTRLTISSELMEAISQGALSGTVDFEVSGAVTPEVRAILLKSAGLAIRHWKQLKDQRDSQDK